MRARHVGLVVVLVILGLLGAANWTTIMQPTDLNLLVSRVQAPFGLVMLSVVGMMACLYIVILLLGERHLRNENAKQAQELAALRKQVIEEHDSQVQNLEHVFRGELAELRAQLSRAIEEMTDIRSERG